MVPSAYVQLDEMPLTPNGKVNTKVLPEPKSNKSESGRLPKNELEKTFCDIFAEILELDNVFADDNFFDLGGTSLTATRIVISASKKNIEVAYSDIFANPTPQTLAKFVSKEIQPKMTLKIFQTTIIQASIKFLKRIILIHSKTVNFRSSAMFF